MAQVIIDVKGAKNDFVFLPACCYAGNQFMVLKKKYPPMFLPDEAGVDMDMVITDVPVMLRYLVLVYFQKSVRKVFCFLRFRN